jgi:bifunctional N6-L-threonylcarbamoyladenine synthase / protein kinase Bud32
VRRLLLALDTSTEVTSVGLAWLVDDRADMIGSSTEDAPRAAMSRLLPMVDSLLAEHGLSPGDIAEIIVGRGPGSFTGVRIGVATAKGLAQGLGVGLVGVGTLDAIAWGFAGTDALLGVVGDAMRGEVYSALFRCEGGRVARLAPDRVARPGEAAAEWAELGESVLLAGNGLRKHGEDFSAALGASARFADEELWPPRPRGLFDAYLALDDGERGEAAPKDPGILLPIYTRLSDAEENEAARAAAGDALPASGVAGNGGRA